MSEIWIHGKEGGKAKVRNLSIYLSIKVRKRSDQREDGESQKRGGQREDTIRESDSIMASLIDGWIFRYIYIYIYMDK